MTSRDPIIDTITARVIIKQKYLDQILAGKKRYELRLRRNNLREIQPDDYLEFIDQSTFQIKNVWDYNTVYDLPEDIDYTNFSPEFTTREIAIEAALNLYPIKNQKKYGIIVIELNLDKFNLP